MARTHVLRIPRSDGDDGSFVLAHVTPSPSKKARPLDLKLVATEGENPYSVSLQHSKIDSLKSSGSSEEWERVLTDLFLERGSADGIVLTAAVRSTKLEITVRKRIQGITQRLGAISLHRNDDEEDSDVTAWCGIAVEARDEAKAELASLTVKAQELEGAVVSLKDQLDKLIKAKEEHESELLERFRNLLNSKKDKIRKQQTLLESLGHGPVVLASTSLSRDQASASGHVPVASRRSKRKADVPEPSANGDSDDGFEGMEVDAVKKEYEEGSDQDLSAEEQRTTDDDATASEPEPDDDDAGDVGDVAGNSKSGPKQREAAAGDRKTTSKPTKGKQKENEKEKGKQREKTPTLDDLPPQRVLPFAAQGAKSKNQPAPSTTAPDQGSETESDDEL